MTQEAEIVHESPRFVLVDKPAGWLSVPGRFDDGRDSRQVAGRWLEQKLGSRVWPVHRLDAEVSGILLFARDAQAHRDACARFEERSVTKTYQAWTEGFAEAAGEAAQGVVWRCTLARGKKRAFEAPHGKPAETAARYVGAGPHGLKWELEPHTGRPHQLRFELARHGFSIVGDALYGAKRPWEAGGIALRAVAIDFGAAPLEGLAPRLAVTPLFDLG